MAKRIVVAPWGSAGDIYPFLSVASRLAKRGHDVAVAAPAAHENKVRRAGLPFVVNRPDVAYSPPFPEGLDDPKKSFEVLFRQMLAPKIRDSYADLKPLCEQADLIVAHPLSLAVPILAEQLEKKWIAGFLQPLAFFSTYDPPYVPAFPWLYTLRRLGRLPYSLVFAMLQGQLKKWLEPVDGLRRELGLKPIAKDTWEGTNASRRVGTLAMFSREFAREQPDWPEPSWLTGFAWPEAMGDLPPELDRFLDHKDAPVIFTLGDSGSWFPSRFYEHSLEAVRRLGLRAVFLTGSTAGAAIPKISQEQIFATEFAPFAKVFPRAAAVVHVGGIGATALALQARCPMLLTPFYFDQADNAERARRLGVARVLELSRYNAADACSHLEALLSNPSYRQRATEIGARLDAENGAMTSCDRIEEVLR